jgi:hypothetical protein
MSLSEEEIKELKYVSAQRKPLLLLNGKNRCN